MAYAVFPDCHNTPLQLLVTNCFSLNLFSKWWMACSTYSGTGAAHNIDAGLERDKANSDPDQEYNTAYYKNANNSDR